MKLAKFFVHTTKGAIHVQEAGSGPACLVLLSITSFGGVLVHQALECFAERGYRALALDLMGYGRSDKRDGEWLVEDFASNIAEAIDAMQLAVDGLVCGHFSGWIGLHLAQSARALKGMVLDGTPYFDRDTRAANLAKPATAPVIWTEDGAHALEYWQRCYAMLKRLDPSIDLTQGASQKFREAYIALLETLSFEPGTSAAAAHFDIESHLASLKIPALVMSSDHDWNLKHHDVMLSSISHATSHRFAGVHPLHDLGRRDRAFEYVDVVDQFFRPLLAEAFSARG